MKLNLVNVIRVFALSIEGEKENFLSEVYEVLGVLWLHDCLKYKTFGA